MSFGRTRFKPACAVLVIACAVLRVGADTSPAEANGLLGEAYPLEVSVAFHKALLHWVDSLAMLTGHGATGGKTIPAHRGEFDRLLGKPTRRDASMLQRYHAVRTAHLRKVPPEERDRITLAFFESSSLDEALERAGELLEPAHAKAFAQAVRHFASRYETVWNGGEVVQRFLTGVRNSGQRRELTEFLVQVARFFGVAPDGEPRPQIVFVPVPSGYGTHAQAVGPFLLIEIRRGEDLADEVGPIVHENVHFLYRRIPQARRDRLGQVAIEAGGEEAWALLREALPTAIAQGVAERSFRDGTWSREGSWYHEPSVDLYAKRIFPLIDEALANGETFDETLVRKLVAAHDPPTVITPRSP